MTNERFHLKPVADDLVTKLSEGLGVTRVMARVLAARGFSDLAQAQNFLQAPVASLLDPFLLRDMDIAVTRLGAAIRNQEKICIYGDYDVDGAVSTALLLRFLRALGADVFFTIPNRVREGYSLNEPALLRVAAQGAKIVITVDNGITAHAGVRLARELGMEVIITDHHQVGETLPEALAVMDPQRPDCTYPFKGICGAGVTFKLMMALRQALRREGFFTSHAEPNLRHELDILSIATVCDCMPLVAENRTIVREGLQMLASTRKVGLRALLEVSGITDKLTSRDLGFKLGPRLNACGRLDDASLGVRLLLTDDPHEAEMLARQLDSLNQERQVIEKEMVAEALATTGDKFKNRSGIVLYEPSWHIGVLGIVASRIAELFHKPTFVLARAENGMVKGSGRAAGVINLVAALSRCGSCLTSFGGHEAAAGVTLAENQVESFCQGFDLACHEILKGESAKPAVSVDGMLSSSEISHKLCEELGLLEPCGIGNSRPLFATREPIPVLSRRVVGQDHLKLSLGGAPQALDAIAFRQASALEQVKNGLSAIFGIEKNRFRERETIQLVIHEIL